MQSDAGAELERRMEHHAQDASTVSSDFQQTAQSSEQYNLGTLHTTPTSQEPSHAQPKPIDSDLEAQYGSDSLYSFTSTESSSNGSDNSREELPQPTREFRIKEIGGHLADTIPHVRAPTTTLDDDNKAGFVAERIKRAFGKQLSLNTDEEVLKPWVSYHSRCRCLRVTSAIRLSGRRVHTL